jgi:hypothetical protein
MCGNAENDNTYSLRNVCKMETIHGLIMIIAVLYMFNRLIRVPELLYLWE